MIEFLQGVFETRTQAEWVEWFHGKDIGFAPVRNLREALDDGHVRARGMRVVDEDGIEHLGVPIRYAREPARPRFRVPSLGEHPALLPDEAGSS